MTSASLTQRAETVYCFVLEVYTESSIGVFPTLIGIPLRLEYSVKDIVHLLTIDWWQIY